MIEHDIPEYLLDELVLPAHSMEAEQAVIGSLILYSEKYDDVLDIVEESDFYGTTHKQIFHAMSDLTKEDQPIDAMTISQKLQQIDLLDKIGGLAYILNLTKGIPNTSNLLSYAKIVADKSTERKILSASLLISEISRDGEITTEDKITQSRQLLEDIESKGGEEVEQISGALRRLIEDIDQKYNSDEKYFGITTGLTAIDEKIQGFEGGDYIIIAARPSMGKTTLLMNIVEHIAVEKELPVLVFSMEMPEHQLMQRLTSSISEIPLSLVRNGKLRDDHWPKLSSAISKLKDCPLYIDDRPALTATQIRATARKMHKKHGLGAIAIDYMQLAKSKAENRNMEITDISGTFKSIAKELNIPVIALSQLNRKLEDRANRRPIMSDLRESGAIEQDADIIMFLYRDEVYNEFTEQKNVAEVIIAKARNGTTGTAHIKSDLHISRFNNLDGPTPQHENTSQGGFGYD